MPVKLNPPKPASASTKVAKVATTAARPSRKGLIGRHLPTHETRDQVRKLVLLGSNHVQIAGCLGISIHTLQKHYKETLSYYQSRMLSEVAGKAYGMALKGNPFMIQFVLRTRAGWKEKLLGEEDMQLIKRVIGVPDADV